MKDLELIFSIFNEVKGELLTHLNFESPFELDTKKGIIESKLNNLIVWLTKRLSKTNKLEYEDLEELHQNLINLARQSIESKIINEESVNRGYYSEIVSIYERINRILIQYKKRFPKEESIKKVYHSEVIQYVFQDEREVREHIKKMKQEDWRLKSRYSDTNPTTNQTETCVTYEKRIEEE